MPEAAFIQPRVKKQSRDDAGHAERMRDASNG
jgi:hypothetical protein